MLTAQPFVQADSPVEIAAVSAPPEKPDMTAPRLVLKQGGTMVMVNPQGLMPQHPDQALGMIVDDTRGLKVFDIRMNDRPLQFIDGSAQASYTGIFRYMNPETLDLAPGVIQVENEIVIDGDLFYRLTFRNHGDSAVNFELGISYGAGFEDTFEVRGSHRNEHGVTLPAQTTGNKVRLGYIGLDRISRLVELQFAGANAYLGSIGQATFAWKLEPRTQNQLEVRVSYRRGVQVDEPISSDWSFGSSLARARAEFDGWMSGNARIETSNSALNQVLQRSVEDINMLRLGPLGIAAGLPQFAVPFGRDSAITGLQTCWLMPSLSEQIILALAARQGTKYDTKTAEEPGKIMHELRTGEMVNNGEAPFGPYYGTVDATQLWLMLLVEYTKWTGDLEFVRKLWPNVIEGVKFLRRRSRRGYITYGGKPGEALANQCWKDSFNSIMYSDGKLAVAPIAVCEAQGYMYAAFVGVADLADKLGKRAYSRSLSTRASVLKRRFQKDFWVKKLDFVALALDKDLKQCDVISSNPGHLLELGILSRRQARLVAQRLMQPDMFNGWFIRTLASSEVAYNEDDYQVGAGWPHDNGIASVGMRSIGHNEDALKVFEAHVDIACAADDRRLHELYCGTARSVEPKHPKNYKVACVPQAWAAGSILHMLRACLNPVASNGALLVSKPLLPVWLPWVTVSGLRIGDKEVDLHFYRKGDGGTGCKVLRNEMNARVVIRT